MFRSKTASPPKKFSSFSSGLYLTSLLFDWYFYPLCHVIPFQAIRPVYIAYSFLDMRSDFNNFTPG